MQKSEVDAEFGAVSRRPDRLFSYGVFCPNLLNAEAIIAVANSLARLTSGKSCWVKMPSVPPVERKRFPTTSDRSQPLLAQSRTIHRSMPPVAYDCVKLVFVRAGSAVLFSEFGMRHASVGDVVALSANTLCGSQPEGHFTATTLYLDRDYVVDQVSWQHATFLADWLDAQDFADELYSEPAQILRLGEDRAGMLMPWLDELVALSIDGPSSATFYRMQARLFAVLDVITPNVKTTPVRRSPTQRKATQAGTSRLRQFVPLRADVARQT